MALKALMVRKKIDDKKTRLEAVSYTHFVKPPKGTEA